MHYFKKYSRLSFSFQLLKEFAQKFVETDFS